MTPEQDETLPFTREQYEALLEATYYYDSRGKERNGDTTNSRRVRAYLKLLRWSGLRAGDTVITSGVMLLKSNQPVKLFQKVFFIQNMMMMLLFMMICTKNLKKQQLH